MNLKGIYAGKPAVSQLAILLLLILLGAFFSSMISMGIFSLIYGFQADITQYPDMLRLAQLLSSIGTFLLPALILAELCSDHPKTYLSIGKTTRGEIWILTFISVFLISPTINLTGWLNNQLELPAFMAPIEEWIRAQEDAAERFTLILINGDGVLTLVSNLIVIALAAAVTEEFLFRGALQRVIGKWSGNRHVIIWSTAFIFSAFHMQFFGFLPRMLLGAYFGYLLYWSQNIWIPVFAHFINNAFAVISMSEPYMKENAYITGDLSTQHLFPYTLVALILLVPFYLCLKRIKHTLLEPKTPSSEG